MIKAGIIGAAGYTAGELMRVLLQHPEAEIVLCQSESQAGKPVSDIHRDLTGQTGLHFEQGLEIDEADVLFLCKGHGESKKIVEAHPHLLRKKVVDLSHDFRLQGTHSFVYGLPEKNREHIIGASHIANPGCFATCIQMGLLPAVANKIVAGDIHVSGITGSTGAGQSLSPTSHFSWRSNNASVYKPLKHQHLLEINETVAALDPSHSRSIHFIPYRGAFTRGIVTTTYFETSSTGDELEAYYKNYYAGHPFTVVADKNPDLKWVVNTNKAIVYPQVIDGTAIIVSVIDNLLKGASGQAVQNMNLMFGVGETTGLGLKASAF